MNLVCYSQFPELFNRMKKSAEKTACGELTFSYERCFELPHLANAYNRLGKENDINVFVHDDVEFISKGWDLAIEDGLKDFDIVGAVGTELYAGGRHFHSGNQYAIGRIGMLLNEEVCVRIFREISKPTPVQLLDGCLMACSGEYFKSHKYDEKYNEMWYFDVDWCLKARCAALDILISHSKPPEFRDRRQPNAKTLEDYTPMFNKQYGFSEYPEGPQECPAIPIQEYLTVCR